MTWKGAAHCVAISADVPDLSMSRGGEFGARCEPLLASRRIGMQAFAMSTECPRIYRISTKEGLLMAERIRNVPDPLLWRAQKTDVLSLCQGRRAFH